MFVTPPTTPVGGFTEGIENRALGSQLRSAWLTYVSAQLPNALDAINGGYYQFVADIKLSSDTKQIKINAPAVGQPTKLLGYTTIGLSDDANYAVGTGALIVSIPATFSAGVTMSGALTFSNTVQFNGAVTVNAATTFTSNGDITLQSGCDLIGQSGSTLQMQAGSTTTLASANTLSGVTTISGAVGLTGRRQIRRTRVVLADASQSVNVGQGDRFLLPASNAAPRNIELTSTGTVPNEGESLEFVWHPSGGGGGGTQYTFKREDATVVASFVGATVTDTGTVCAEFEFTGGVWKLGRSSGTPSEYIPPVPGPESWNSYGVIPGAGA